MSERLIRVTCCHCQDDFAMTESTHAAYKRNELEFTCPHGHKQYFPLGPTEAEKLRRERDRLKQRLAQKDDRIKQEREGREAAERSASAHKGVATRLKNRAKAGVCPCCNRTFQNLAKHMETKHPDFGGDDEKVVKLKTA